MFFSSGQYLYQRNDSITGFVNWGVFEEAEDSFLLTAEAVERILKSVLWGC